GTSQHFGEVSARVGPLGDRRPAAGKKQHPAAPLSVFVAVLNVDRRAFGHGEAGAGHAETDVTGGNEMDFDPRQDVVPARFVAEGVDWNVAVELAVHAYKNVQSELG